jgi:hypothetical protein
MTAGSPAVFARPKPLTVLPKTSILRRKVASIGATLFLDIGDETGRCTAQGSDQQPPDLVLGRELTDIAIGLAFARRLLRPVRARVRIETGVAACDRCLLFSAPLTYIEARPHVLDRQSMAALDTKTEYFGTRCGRARPNQAVRPPRQRRQGPNHRAGAAGSR